MSSDPTRTFSANTGQASVGNAGPDAIEATFDSIISAFLAHKQATDPDHRNQFYTKAEVDAFLDGLILGQLSPGSVTNSMLATDIKVGSLAALTTTDKSALVNAINELVSGKIAKSLLTTQGDIIYASAPSTPARLAKGTAGQVLQMNSGATAPEWSEGNGLIKIAETTLGSGQASITFNSIPQTYKALKLFYKIRGTVAGEGIDILMRFNGDTGSNYKQLSQYILASQGTLSTYSVSLTTSANIGFSTAASSPANAYGIGELLIPNYTETMIKNGLFNFGSEGGANSSWRLGSGHAYWNSTAAINSITLLPSTGNFEIGTSIVLYGIK